MSAAIAGAQTTTRVSVVVCAYTLDRWDDLARAVASLRGQTIRPAEMIVVSDHNPELAKRVRTAWADVIALENREPAGLSGARNTGVAAATGDIIAFLDDDAAAEPDWLTQLLAAYADPAVAGAGGAIAPRWVAGRPAWFPEEFDWVVGCSYRGMPERPARVRNLIGANMSFRRELLDAAGNFQTGMGRIGARPLGCEETELCIRGSRRLPGAVYAYRPAAVVRHTVPPSRGTWRYFAARCYSEGLSKAHVAELVGADAGLAAERSYTRQTLPRGVWRGLCDAARGDVDGLRRAAAIVAGLAITTFGYGRGTLARRLAAGRRGASQPERAPAEAA